MESTTKTIPFAGAIFDMDGTLINSIIYWDYFWKELGEKFVGDPALKPGTELELRCRTMLFTEVLALVKEVYNIPNRHEELVEYFFGSVERFYREKVEIKPGVLPFLDYLKENNVPMCIASASAREHIMIAAERCGLLPYFSTILTCPEIGKGKDQPDIYALALKTLGTPKDQTWVFEDSLTALTTAHRFGLKTVGVSDPGEPRQAQMQQLADLYVAPGEEMAKFIV